jgi:hypothetical protein
MAVLWVGHEVASYLISSANNVEFTGGVRVDDTTYERTPMRISVSGVGDLTSTPDWTAVNEIWQRFNHSSGAATAGKILWAARNASGVNMAQIIITGTGTTADFQVWNGSTYTTVGTITLLTVSTKYRWDIHFKGGSSGQVEVYYGSPGSQTLVVNTTGSYTSAINIVRIYFGPISTASLAANNPVVAHSIVQTTSTLSSTSEVKPPTSNGSDVDGTGTWADVDETVFSDVDVITLASTGQHQSFKAAARTLTQAVVTGVTASCRAWFETGGPSQLKPYLTIGGTRFYGTTFTLSLTAQAYQYTWLTNPSTGVAFTTAEANAAALEWGWEAA